MPDPTGRRLVAWIETLLFERAMIPLIRLGVPHLYVSYAGYLCFAYKRGIVWHTGIVGRGYKVWRER